jgi:hypothetical protein
LGGLRRKDGEVFDDEKIGPGVASADPFEVAMDLGGRS